eukprot:UN10464
MSIAAIQQGNNVDKQIYPIVFNLDELQPPDKILNDLQSTATISLINHIDVLLADHGNNNNNITKEQKQQELIKQFVCNNISYLRHIVFSKWNCSLYYSSKTYDLILYRDPTKTTTNNNHNIKLLSLII